MERASVSLLLLLLGLSVVNASAFHASGSVLLHAVDDEINAQVWEDATAASIVKARACLADAPLLLGMYYPQFLAAFANDGLRTVNNVTCEALILGTMYQRLSGALPPCEAMVHGIRACAHWIAAYAGPAPIGNPGLSPAAFPVRPFTVQVNECNTAINTLHLVDRTNFITAFRHRFSEATNCLRLNTRQALVASTLFPGLV